MNGRLEGLDEKFCITHVKFKFVKRQIEGGKKQLAWGKNQTIKP